MKTITTHTPGPWKLETWDYSHATPPRKELNVQSATHLLATVQCDFTGDNPYTIPQDEAEANARLIAAAPDMLDALKNIPMDCDHTYPHLMACWVCKAKAAIAKTEGN